MKLIDTNVFLRYITSDDPVKSQETKALFDRIIRGDEDAMTTDVVVHEVCYVLTASTFYNLSHKDVRDRLYPYFSSLLLRYRTKICA